MKRITRLHAALLAAFLPAAYAAAPDTEAVEFYNVNTKHYFVTATASEAAIVEGGGAGPGWLRTGRSFQAWLAKSAAPADAQPVCRFYSRGANSHFYTAGASECAGLKASNSGWLYEGVAFFVQVPAAGGCPAGTVELLRAYNRGFTNGEGSNHRFIDDASLKELMVESGWVAEGAVFCAAAKPTGTNANLRATTTSFEALAGTWSGDARFKVEEDDIESATRAPLSLALDADGAITGSGAGCTFTGQATSGDGFRSFFMATVTAAGCTDPLFNGDYTRVKLQRFGDSTLMVRLRQGDESTEVSIDARLTLEGATPPVPPAVTAEGTWKGTVKWEAESGGVETEGNRSLTLTIDAAGAVTGSGSGCTFTGTVGGDVIAAGCTDALFNGTFRLRIVRLGNGRIEVQLKREAGGTEVKIQGQLVKDDGSPTTPPPPLPADPLVTGEWDGAAAFSAGTASGSGTLHFTLGADGALSGSAFGCTLAGNLTLSMGGRTVVAGSVTASGCTEAALNGTYTRIEVEREGANGLEVELQRETGGVRAKVKAKVRRVA